MVLDAAIIPSARFPDHGYDIARRALGFGNVYKIVDKRQMDMTGWGS